MELRRLAICLAFFVLTVSQCSEGHSMRRLQSDDYDDSMLADDTGDDEAQNDTDNNGSESLQQKPPATIETAPTNYEIKSGESVRLECKVVPETTVVQWYKDNVPYFMGSLPLNPESGYSIVPNSKDLLIENARAVDSGVFRCETLQKSPAAINHTLLVTQKPVVTNISATNGGVVVEGEPLTVTCHVTGSPTPTVIWSLARDDVPNVRLTEKDGEFSVNNNVYSLFIRSVKRDQGGKYYCYAVTNAGGHQAEITVVVNHKPHVHVPRAVVNSALKIEAVLECLTHEAHRPHFRWYKDGILIEDTSSNYKISTHGLRSNLSVIPTADSDFGTFTCVAENEYGTHNKSIDLVETPVVEDLKADGARLTWTIISHQPLEQIELDLQSYAENTDDEWKQFQVPLPEGNDNRYEVSYLLEDRQVDAGEYQAYVKVQNSKGWSSSDNGAIVKIDAQPQLIQHASVFRDNAAHSIRPAHTVLSTILMYLLMRMF